MTTEKDYLTEIGKLVTVFNLLEHQIVIGIIIVSGIQPAACRRMLAGESFDTLLKMFDVLVRSRIKDDKIIRTFTNIVKNIETIKNKRNHFLHARWSFNKNESKMEISKYGKKHLGSLPKLDTKPIDLKQLLVIFGTMVFVTGQLFLFLNEHFVKETDFEEAFTASSKQIEAKLREVVEAVTVINKSLPNNEKTTPQTPKET